MSLAQQSKVKSMRMIRGYRSVCVDAYRLRSSEVFEEKVVADDENGWLCEHRDVCFLNVGNVECHLRKALAAKKASPGFQIGLRSWAYSGLLGIENQ